MAREQDKAVATTDPVSAGTGRVLPGLGHEVQLEGSSERSSPLRAIRDLAEIECDVRDDASVLIVSGEDFAEPVDVLGIV